MLDQRCRQWAKIKTELFLCFLGQQIIRWTNVGLMLSHRLRRWPNIKPTLVKRPPFAGILSLLCILSTEGNQYQNTVQYILSTEGNQCANTVNADGYFRFLLSIPPDAADKYFKYLFNDRLKIH